jgi:excinuclease UvrABC ATPase subunit
VLDEPSVGGLHALRQYSSCSRRCATTWSPFSNSVLVVEHDRGTAILAADHVIDVRTGRRR